MWVVPWRFDPVGTDEHLLHDPESEDDHNYCDSDLALVFGYSVQFHHVQISEPNESGEDADDVAFTCPLSTLTSHEVFGDDDGAVLVSLVSEPRHIVEGGIDDTSRANDPHDDGDSEPHQLV